MQVSIPFFKIFRSTYLNYWYYVFPNLFTPANTLFASVSPLFSTSILHFRGIQKLQKATWSRPTAPPPKPEIWEEVQYLKAKHKDSLHLSLEIGKDARS